MTQVNAQNLSSEFPNGRALLEFVHGVNQNKVPEVIHCKLSLRDYYEDKLIYSGEEYLRKANEHIILYNNDFGLNAKINRNNFQYIRLKDDIVYKSAYLDLELFALLGIHILNAEKSDSILRSIGVDTDIITDAIRLGRSAWVIGSDGKQMDVPQIWIDKEYLSVRRLNYINLPQESVQKLEWENYEDLNGFYFPKNMGFKNDPEIYNVYTRSDIKLLKKLPEDIKGLFTD